MKNLIKILFVCCIALILPAYKENDDIVGIGDYELYKKMPIQGEIVKTEPNIKNESFNFEYEDKFGKHNVTLKMPKFPICIANGLIINDIKVNYSLNETEGFYLQFTISGNKNLAEQKGVEIDIEGYTTFVCAIPDEYFGESSYKIETDRQLIKVKEENVVINVKIR